MIKYRDFVLVRTMTAEVRIFADELDDDEDWELAAWDKVRYFDWRDEPNWSEIVNEVDEYWYNK